MKQYNIMDLFAGVGGLSYGFSMLPQFNIIAANEIEKDISIAYELNHPNVKMLNCDINDLTEDMLNEALSGQKNRYSSRRAPLSIIFNSWKKAK